MDLERYTDNAKETMVEAMEIARALDHQTITTTHVMKAILSNNKKRFKKLIELAGGDYFLVLQEVDKLLISIPKVEGHKNLLVHGPLTATTVLNEVCNITKCSINEFSFSIYKPIFVNEKVVLKIYFSNSY